MWFGDEKVGFDHKMLIGNDKIELLLKSRKGVITAKRMRPSRRGINLSEEALSEDLKAILASPKLKTILSRSTTTTRIRDYYNVNILTTLRSQDINGDLFAVDFKNTAQ